MLSYLAELEYIWGPFRLFGYLTIRCGLAILISLIVGFSLAPWLFNKLRQLKVAQSLRNTSEVGQLANLHAKKKDTPTMGGILLYVSIIIATLLCTKLNIYVLVALIVFTGLTIIGFLDDYLKVTKKNSKGLNSRWKLGGQALLTFVAVGILLGNIDTHMYMSELWVPFLKEPLIGEMPIWFIFIFFFFIMAGTSNAINLTDGIDGLAIGCTIPVALVYGVFAYVTSHAVIANYLQINHIVGIGEVAVLCSATVGASLAFLWYNCHPAEVFMGDTGSLGLGGLVGAVAFMVQEPFTLIIVGGVFVMEAVSVILQIFSFKTFNRRIFRMAPIHHHFELKGWHENKVVIRFWIISLLFALAGLSILKLR